MSKKLQELIDNLEVIQKTYPEDACLIVADQNHILAYLPGEQFDLKIELGASLERYKGSVTEKTLKTGRPMQEERGAELLGIGYIATASPVLEDGKVVGALTALVSTGKIGIMRTGAVELSATVEEMSATTEQITHASSDTATRLQSLLNVSNEMMEDIKNIQSVLAFVQDISSQSHMLGLNAAIEAARAGEHGRGFSVVANEIRKMAEQSKQAASNIRDQLQHIQKTIERINGTIVETAAFTQQHAASMDELNKAFEHIASTADKLASISVMD